jgi:hypothetical protein
VLEHLGVLGAEPVVLGRGKAELTAEAAQEVWVAAELAREPGVGCGRLDRLGQEEPEWEGELPGGDATGDVLERDPCVLKGRHQANDVDARGHEEAIAVRLEQPELLQPANVLGGTRDEVGKRFCSDPIHGLEASACRRRA